MPPGGPSALPERWQAYADRMEALGYEPWEARNLAIHRAWLDKEWTPEMGFDVQWLRPGEAWPPIYNHERWD